MVLLALALVAVGSLPVEDHYADSGGVKIHYVTHGPDSADAPLVVMVHGFPDFWYTWRDQMKALGAAGYRCAAMDLRGYNLSDKPTEAAQYDMRLLVGDVLAVIRAEKRQKAIVMGHDWGGAISWQVALNVPQVVDRLVILNLPHPRGLSREMAKNPAQQAASEYARRFQQEGSEKALTAEGLAGWVRDEAARKEYVAAFERSSLRGMMAYYQRNYPRPPYPEPTGDVVRLKMPVLLIHGLKDTALLAPALNSSWDWMEDLTLVTIPEAGHFVQQDATDKVSRSVLMFLGRDK
jgi:pimeloyl-ACP methyl ester carboxylesterase